MPNICNPRIKPNNPDSVQKGIEPRVCLQPQYLTGQAGKGIEPLSYLERSSRSCLKGLLKGRSQGKIDAAERGETALIQQYRQPSYSWNPPRISSQRKVSDQKSQMKINSPRRISCVFRSTLVGPPLIICIVIM